VYVFVNIVHVREVCLTVAGTPILNQFQTLTW